MSSPVEGLPRGSLPSASAADTTASWVSCSYAALAEWLIDDVPA